MITISNDKLLQAQSARRWSIADLAAAAETSPKTTAEIMRGDVDSKTMGKIAAIARALGATAVRVTFEFDPAGSSELAAAE